MEISDNIFKCYINIISVARKGLVLQKKNYAHLNRISNHQLKMATSKFMDFMKNSKNANFKAFIADAKEVMTVLSFWLINTRALKWDTVWPSISTIIGITRG